MRGRLYTGSFAVVLLVAMLVMTGCPKKPVIDVSGLTGGDDLDFGTLCDDFTKTFTVTNTGGGTLKWSAAKSDDDWFEVSPSLPTSGKLKKNKSVDITVTVKPSKLPEGIATAGTITLSASNKNVQGLSIRVLAKRVCVQADTVKPVITLLGANPETVAVGSVYTDAGATASDNVDGDITSQIVVGGLPIDTSAPGTHTVTYDVTDAAGNAAVQVTRTVNVTDQTPPVITLLGTTPVTVAVGTPYVDAGATALDNVDGNITANIVVGGLPINTAAPGTHTVTYNVSDAAGNAAVQVTRTVNVTDQTPPVITLLGSNPATVVVNTVYTDAGATATDNVDGNITANIVATSTVNTAVVGAYTVTYNVSDAAGNAATPVVRNVNVIAAPDTTPPVITLLGANPVTVAVGSVYTDAGATALDDVDGNITANIVATSTVNTAVVGTYTVTYNVSDAAGNAATPVVRTVNVTDQTAPVITLLGANPVTVAVGSVYTDAGATATDNVDGNITANIVVGGLPINTAAPGTHTVTYNVSDAAGNAAVQVTRTVNVTDQTAPVITLLGANPVTVAVNSVYVDAGATATDNVDGNITANIVATSTVNTAVLGTYTVTYNVSDAAGNAATPVVRTVIVVNLFITPSAATLIEGDSVILAATSGVGDTSYTWDVVDGTVASLSTVGVLYNEVQVTALPRLNGLEASTNVNVTGDQSNNTASALITVIPNVVTVDPPSATIEVGQTVTLVATTLSQNDSFIWGSSNPAIAVVAAGAVYNEQLVTGVAAGGPVDITATGSATNRSATSAITVVKTTPAVTWPTSATPIAAGHTLAESILSSDGSALNPWTGAPVAGTFAFADPSFTPPQGNYTAALVFTPADTANYNIATGGTVIVPVSGGVVISPPSAEVFEGDQVQLTAMSAVTESGFTWEVLAPAVVSLTMVAADVYTVTGLHLDSDTNTQTQVQATGDTSGNFGLADILVKVSAVTVTPPAAAIEVGQTVQLTASSLTQLDSFGWGTSNGLVATVVSDGIYTAMVTAQGAGSANITATGTASGRSDAAVITVNKATPTVTFATSSSIFLGQTLASAVLTGGSAINPHTGATVAGTFAFVDPSIEPAQLGSYTADVMFIPTDTANYNTVVGTVSVAVEEGVFVTPNSATIYEGDRIQLTPGSNAGDTAFDWAIVGPAAVSIEEVGEIYTWVTALHQDSNVGVNTAVQVTGTLSSLVASADIYVAINTVEITPAGPVTIEVGETLTLSATTNTIRDEFTWQTVGTAVSLAAGAIYNEQVATGLYAGSTATVTATGTASLRSDSVEITVVKTTPVVTFPTAAMVYGQTLSQATIIGGSATNPHTGLPVPGGWEFASPNDVPSVTTDQPFAAMFVPADADNYNQVAGVILVTVVKADPVVTWPTASLGYGQTLADAVQAGGSGDGVFTFLAPATAPTVADSGTAYAAIFTPTDTVNYNSLSGTIVVTVSKAAPLVIWPTATAFMSQTLADAVLTGGSAANPYTLADVPGTFPFDAPATVLPVAGVQIEPATFTPTDTANYETVPGSVTVTVSNPVSVAPTSATLYEGCTVDLTATSLLAGDTTFTWTPLVSTAISLTGAGDLYTVTALHQDSDTDTAEQVIVTGDASGGSATADITVLVNTVTVTPASDTIEVGETTTLTGTTLAVCDLFDLGTTSTAVATVAAGALYNEAIVTGVGAGTVTITMTGTASQRFAESTITVVKATPSIVAPTGSIVCGDTLAEALFAGGSAINPHTGLPVAGTWVFDSPGEAPTASGTFVAAFTPVEDANYNSVPTLIDVTVIPALEILSVDAPGAGGNGATGEDAAPNGNVLKAFTVGVYADQGAHMDSSLLAPEEILPSGGWATVDANDALDIYYYGESDTTGIPNIIVSWVADECNPDFYRPQAFGTLSASFAKVAGQAVVNVVGIYTMESCTAVYTPLGDSSFPNIIDFNLGCVAK